MCSTNVEHPEILFHPSKPLLLGRAEWWCLAVFSPSLVSGSGTNSTKDREDLLKQPASLKSYSICCCSSQQPLPHPPMQKAKLEKEEVKKLILKLSLRGSDG